ncbi:hypothetical protein AGMMS50293_02380 [Spirochaetia bacterium]|nr:hypothetical protein AGMMS50293_02380 [Spirochaetia bacterium]
MLLTFGLVLAGCNDDIIDNLFPALEGTVSISGTVAVGQTLTANIGSLQGSGTISYEWKRGDTATAAGNAIFNATSATYTLVNDDLNKYITVTVSRVGYSGSKTSAASGPVAAAGAPALEGTVSISGTATVGQTLSANTSSLQGSGTISYEWKRGDTATAAGNAIFNATSATYTLVNDDLNKYITITVSRVGYSGSKTSAASGPVSPGVLEGMVSIIGIATVGETLTANTDSLQGSEIISYEWKRGDTADAGTAIPNATSASYTLVAADEGKYITVTVSRVGYSGSKTSAASGPVSPGILDGTVSISGTATVGETLTAYTISLQGSGAISYAWKRGEAADAGTAIPNATSETYILVAADEGKYITITVSRAGYSGSKTSAASGPVLPGVLEGMVSISGTATVGETLTAYTVSLQGSGAISYEWKRGDTAETAGTPVDGATSASYTLVAADEGKYITVTVSRAGYSGSKTSAASGPVVLPALEGTVSISGIATAGQALTANTGNLQGTGTISFTWKRGDTEDAGTAIPNATSASYTLVAADEGKYITVTVSRTGYSGSKTSAAIHVPYVIGSTGPGGGKVFYISEKGFTINTGTYNGIYHYLEAAPEDMSENLAWASSSFMTIPISAEENDFGSGAVNTARILAKDTNAPAAKACDDYTNNDKTDWYLPSLRELDQMYKNKTVIDGLGTWYWSSFEYDSYRAFSKNVIDDGQGANDKSSLNRVRAVRAF